MVLGVSERHSYRIKAKIRKEGVKGVVHGNRGRRGMTALLPFELLCCQEKTPDLCKTNAAAGESPLRCAESEQPLRSNGREHRRIY